MANRPKRSRRCGTASKRRGGKGVKDVKVTAKNGPVRRDRFAVREGDEIMVITAAGDGGSDEVWMPSASSGGTRKGVKVMTPNEGDKIATLAKLARKKQLSRRQKALKKTNAQRHRGTEKKSLNANLLYSLCLCASVS